VRCRSPSTGSGIDFGESLRSVIAETVENPDDVDEELRFLLAVFRR
jgi:hypothetical protein